MSPASPEAMKALENASAQMWEEIREELQNQLLKASRKSQVAEQLYGACDDALSALEPNGSIPLDFGAQHAIAAAFNAGKAYARLIVIADEVFIEQNKKGKKFLGRHMQLGTQTLRDHIVAFHTENGSIPSLSDILADSRYTQDRKKGTVLVYDFPRPGTKGGDGIKGVEITLRAFQDRFRRARAEAFPDWKPHRGRPTNQPT